MKTKKKPAASRKHHSSNGSRKAAAPGGRGALSAGRAAGARAPASKAASKGQDAEPQADLGSIMNEMVQGPVRRISHWETIECPHCGDSFEVHIDSAEDGQTMYEDCRVCCKPMSLHVQVEEEEVSVNVGRA